MNESDYVGKLARFKQEEKPEAVLVIADNQELIRIVVAWTNLELRHADRLTESIGESENQVWEWLWGNTVFSLTDLKLKIGVPYSESVLETKLRPLIGNRIIYPDGTINSFVQRYLREKVLKLFEMKSKKSARRTG